MTGWWLVAFVALAVLVVVLSVLMVALYRLVGVALIRSGPNYARPFQGLAWGSRVPVDELTTAEGGRVHLSGEESLIVKVSPTCGICREIPGALKALRGSHDIRLLVLVEGNRQEAVEWSRRYGLGDFVVVASEDQPPVVSKEISSPYGILLDSDGNVVHHGITNDREMLESLLEGHGHHQPAPVFTG